MKTIENKIVKKVEDNNRKILYKVTPLYMFKRDIVPFGVLFEYESIDKKEKIKSCKFCYNIQKNHKIQISDEDIIKKLQNKSNVSSKGKDYKNYYLNIKDNVFHLNYDDIEKCEELKGIPIKYIQEVTGKKEEIIVNEDFSICKKCENSYNTRFGINEIYDNKDVDQN